MMAFHSLQELYVQQLRDLYDAEQQLVTALPKMADAATLSDLKQGFQGHLDETKQHISRLEQIFNDLGEKPKGEKCQAMKGLIEEGEEIVKAKADAPVKDAGLIAAAQRVEHYEMAGYGSVRTWANQLGRQSDANLLQQTLNEEGETDHKLTSIAERMVNPEAKA
jgi:ferritin-like metal-binding protein YciE